LTIIHGAAIPADVIRKGDRLAATVCSPPPLSA